MTDQAGPSDADGSRQFEESLRLAEYKSVRDEWLASRDAQQHTLQWTFAASAVLLAGILASDARTDEPFLYIAVAGAAAAISIFSQAVWFGEVVRMERAALFLRGLEASFRQLPKGIADRPPLTWETWRGNRPLDPNAPWISPASSSILGSFALFGLLAIAAVVILFSVAFDGQIACGDRVLSAVFGSLAIFIYAAVNYNMCSKALYIYKIRGSASEFEEPASENAPSD